MKTTNIIQRLSLFAFALMLAAPVWAADASGNEDYFNIATKADRKTFCDRVSGGQGRYHGKCR